jgi:hypothetical protein
MALSDLIQRKKKQVEDFFAPVADKVRVRDVVRELPGAAAKVGRSMVAGTESFVKDSGKAFGTGLAYWNPGKVLGDYKREDVSLDDLPTPTRMLANTGRAMLEVGTFGKAPKWAASPNILKRTAQGGGIGYGFDVGEKVADKGEITKEVFKPGMATVAGGIFGAAARPTALAARKEARLIKQDVDNLPTSKRTTVIPASRETVSRELHDAQPSMGTFRIVNGKMKKVGGFEMRHKEGDFQYPEEKVVTPFQPKSATFKFIMQPKAGLSIEDVSRRVPTNKNTQAINKVNAEKNAKAQESVRTLLEMKRSGTQEPKVSVDGSAAVKVPQASNLAAKQADADPIEAFRKSLDETPVPWEKPAAERSMKPVREVLSSPVEEKAQKKLAEELGLMKPANFNKYQQRAYQKKQERIKAIGEVANVQQANVLRAMGYTKREASRLGVDEAKQIAELGKLGYSKKEVANMDFDRRNLTLKHKVHAQTLKEYHRKKQEINTKLLDGIDPKDLKDISPLQAGTRDVYRNFEDVFGSDYKKVKSGLLDPFDEAKGAFIAEQEQTLKELDDVIVKGLGIKKGGKLSAAVQRYGEGKMTVEDLKKEFPRDWEKVVEADKWFRAKYDQMIDELNRVREYYFPTHPLHPESSKIIPKRANYYRHFREMADGFKGLLNIFDTPANIDPSLAVSSEFTKPQTKWLSFAQQRKGDQSDIDAVGGFLDYLKANAYAKHIDPHIQRFRGVDAELASKAKKSGEFFDDSRIGLAEELSRKMDPIQQIADSADAEKIKKILTDYDLSDKQASWMSKELANVGDYEQVKSFIKDKTKKNKEDIFGKMVPKAGAEESENKLNNFLKFLDNFANDLAGKTNPLDRPVQDNFFGRQAFRAINWLNSRVKANVILGNASSALAQFFGIPNGVANAGVRNSVGAIGDSLIGMLKDDAPISKSNFVRERYFNGYDRFDPGVINNTKRFAVWLTSVGDKIGTTFNWNAQYRKALAEGVADPIKYADEWTRKMVAGRGIGEVPIMQKSKLIQLVAPFQLEVANQWRVFADWAKNDPSKLKLAKRLMEFSVATYVMNRVAEELRGSDVAFDPINAMVDAYDAYQDADSAGEGALLAGGRLVGEVLSNFPGGEQAAKFYPEYGAKNILGSGITIPTREKLFGDKDPTRFGGGILAARAITDPLYSLLPPFGGRQIKNTIQGGMTMSKGYDETSGGQVTTPVEQNAVNTVKALLFGKGGINEVQDFRESGQSPLGEKDSELFKLMGGNTSAARGMFDDVLAKRKSNNEREAIKKGKVSEVSGTRAQAGEREESGLYQLSDGSYYSRLTKKSYDSELKARLGDAKYELENSDKNFVVFDDLVLRKSALGEISVMSRDDYDAQIESAKMTAYKKADNLEGWKQSAEKRLELLQKRMTDPTVDDLEKVQIQNQIDTLVGEYRKYGGYGGFKKGKSRAVAASQVNEAKLTSLKRKGNFKAWQAAADEQYKLLAGMLEDPNRTELERLRIQNKMDTLKAQYDRYVEYGGFTKLKDSAIEKYFMDALVPRTRTIRRVPAVRTVAAKRYRFTKPTFKRDKVRV